MLSYHTVLDFILYVSGLQILKQLRKKKYFTCIHIFVYRLAYTFHETIRKKPEVALSIVYTDFLRYKTMN